MSRPEQHTGALGRLGLRALVAAVALAFVTAPFLLLLLAVARQWTPLQRLDDAIATALNEQAHASPLLLVSVRTVTHLGDTAVATYFFVLTAAFLWIRGQRRLAAYMTVTGAGLGVLVVLTKAVVDRARPVLELPVAELPGNASFPSGHAMAVMAMAGAALMVVLPVVRRERRPWCVVAAAVLVIAVGFTRLVLGVHFLSDVVAGWSLGAAWVAVTTLLFRAWQHGMGHRTAAPSTGVGVVDPVASPHPALPPSTPLGLDGIDGTTSDKAVAARLALWALGLTGSLVAMGWLITGPLSGTAFDRLALRLMQTVVEARTPLLNDVAPAISDATGIVPSVAVTVAACVLALAFTSRWRIVVFILTTVAGTTAIYFVASRIVERPRPPVEDLTAGLPPAASWPSGHAAAAVAIYGAMAVLIRAYSSNRKASVVFAVPVSVGLAVGLARIYMGAHYVLDVVAGLTLGTVWLLLCVEHLVPGPDAKPPSRGGHRVSRPAPRVRTGDDES